MKPFIQIALATGHVFEISTQVIAENRAKTMLEAHKDEFADLDAAMVDTVELFDDNYQVEDWAKNNMNPEDYMPGARLVRFVAPEQDFVNAAEWTLHELPAMVGELDGEQIMRQPVEAVLSTMAAAQQLCSITVLNNNDGQPYAAMALIIGPGQVIDAYTKALAFITEKVTAKPEAAPVQ